MTDRAAALTYFGVLAIFPGLLVLISVMGLLGRSNVESLLDNLRHVAPDGVNSFLRTVIEQVQGRSGAASVGAIVGIVVSLWLWVTNIAVLLGVEFNAELQRQQLIEAGLPADVEPFAEPRDTRTMDESEQKRVGAAAKAREHYVNQD